MEIAPNIPESSLPRVIIIGGGFAGINLAKALRKAPFQLVLIDKNNFHLFQPLLYQVATAGLEPSSIAFPIRGIFKKQHNLLFRMAEVLRILTDQKLIETSIGSIRYDYVVIATGSASNYFGNPHFETLSRGMKTLYEAVGIRNHALRSYEEVLLLNNEEDRKKALTSVIVGGGPTGVELAGALAEFKKNIFPEDYPEIPADTMQIYLVEAESRLLANMSLQASASTERFLRKMGVRVLLNTRVKDYDGDTVFLEDGTRILAKTFVWSAGVKGYSVPGIPEAALLRNGRIQVDAVNRVAGQDSLFAIGDVAQMNEDPQFPKGHPMLAQVAIQQGKLLAENLQALQRNRPLKGFRYKDKGTMATIGRNKAVVDLGGIHIHGFLAWMMWMGVHLLFLIGFRNKLVVLINWMYSYVTYERGSRIILRRQHN